MIKDAIGNPLNEGDGVVLQVGNELSFGSIVKVEDGGLLRAGSGLLETGNKASVQVQQVQPHVIVSIMVPRAVSPEGLAAGIIKVEVPEKS